MLKLTLVTLSFLISTCLSERGMIRAGDDGISTQIASIRIGDRDIHIRIHKKGLSDILFFNMHDNENTAVLAGMEIIKEYGGILVELEADGERLITFTSENQKFKFDPNRIYTPTGIKKTLRKYSHYSEKAHQEIQRFVDRLFQYLSFAEISTVVALHNNADASYSIISYMPGGINDKDAEKAHANPQMDSDDFYFVTQPEHFEMLALLNQNVVLQNNRAAQDDGSLSIYCSQIGLPYINVEAQYGHLNMQIEMLRKIVEKL